MKDVRGYIKLNAIKYLIIQYYIYPKETKICTIKMIYTLYIDRSTVSERFSGGASGK